MTEIVIDISADGQTVTVEGKDFTGQECKRMTEAIERALGTVVHERLKPEFHRVATRTRKVGA